jgi:regulator of sigma E protease
MTVAISILAFVVVLTPIVFIHELGHFWVARLNGVRVETFSIGFGRELIGWNDRHGTRWKISLLPLGGYVKFWGDASAASNPAEALAQMMPEERRVSLHGKTVWQRSAVVAAGPAANFLFAIVVFAGVFMTFGQSITPPVIGSVVEGSAAAAAGLRPGDRILSIDGSGVERFEELRAVVALHAETPLVLRVLRDGSEIDLTATPRRVDVQDGLGNTHKMGQLGIVGGRPDYVQLGPVEALWQGVRETGAVISTNLTYLKRWISGVESGDQVSGPIGIAKVSGEVARLSPLALISLMATLSVAIGFINLFPIPMLDGGHLMIYAVEAVRGRPLGERAQEIGFRIGLAMVLVMFLFGTWNDLGRSGVFKFVAGLFS